MNWHALIKEDIEKKKDNVIELLEIAEKLSQLAEQVNHLLVEFTKKQKVDENA
ncbi:MAG: hypothetical protein OEW43_04230 [Elusimicrobiota bacterium]|nr:hypothetical protein [Elusimicrobiota bacterium]MDH5662472.1 hypothetical protein [Elusimicrobiota bacterium]